jgi:hypothetical protein
MERAWKATLALFASIAITMALYVQITEQRSREEADRASATRLEAELAEARAPAESLENPGAEPNPEARQPSDQPLPDTVLRRGESGGSALQKALDSRDARLSHLEESLDALERQAGQSDRALRRDLEELRTAVRRQQDASAKVQGLLLVALIPLLLHLLTSFWQRGDGRRGEE